MILYCIILYYFILYYMILYYIILYRLLYMYILCIIYYVYIMCILCVYYVYIIIYTHYVCNSLRKYFINTLCLGDNDQEGTRKYHRLSRFSWLSSWCFLVEIQCLSPKTLRFLEYLQQVANSKPWPSNSSMIYRAQKL